MTERPDTPDTKATKWLASGAAVALAAGAGFLALAEGVAEHETHALDEAALRWLARHRSAALTHFFGWVTELGSWTFVCAMTLALCALALLLRRWRDGATLALSVIGTPLLIVSLKPLYGRPRPSVVSHLALVDSASFPSGHSIAAAIFFGTLALLAAQSVRSAARRALIALLALFFVGLVALSRMYLGVHYPSDVVGGVLAGTAWSIAIVLLTRLTAARS